MFTGRRRSSSNVKVMQLFHELKQQFPTIPDHIVNSCITSYIQSKSDGKTSNIIELIGTAIAENNLEQMGRPSLHPQSPSLEQKVTFTRENNRAQAVNPFSEFSDNVNLAQTPQQNLIDMTESASDFNRDVVNPAQSSPQECDPAPKHIAKRPTHLDIKPDNFGSFQEISDDKKTFNIRLSEKCKDVHKLLNATLSDKPPRSPLSAKRLAAKSSPTKSDRFSLPSPDSQKQLQDEASRSPQVQRLSSHNVTKTDNDSKKGVKEEELPAVVRKETCSTPTQTTDTLIGNPNLNLSLNVNLDLLQTPPLPRRTSLLELTPSQPWLHTPTSPRSYTSVNLTLRSPSSGPQDPIDITSQNSSLTYSTSSFDSQKGLGSRLQITVGPGGSGAVQSVRVRPKSFHQELQQEMIPTRAGSLNDLAVNSKPPVILKQQARLERLRKELDNEKIRLIRMKQQVSDLEKSKIKKERRIDLEVEKQLLMEIRHLRSQCKELELDGEEFYNNIYTGQRGPLTFQIPPSPRLRQLGRRRLQYQSPSLLPPSDMEGPKWNCGLCTFLNHPVLDKCEQCEMPRIVHGTKSEAINPNITLDALKSLHTNDMGQPNRSYSLNNVPNNMNNPGGPIPFVLEDTSQAITLPGHVNSSRSAPNLLHEWFGKRNRV